MVDELVPEDFLLSPESFEANFVAKRDIGKLRDTALHGGLGHLRNRFLAWRLFLNILPEDGTPQDWVRVTRNYRESYKRLTESQRGTASHDLDPVIFNPLSSAQENPWNSFFEDNELKQRIQLDVNRTYQDKDLFLRSDIQEMMVNILFAWSKEHPLLSYKQGMNELLGILIFVAYAERAPAKMNVSYEVAALISELNSHQGMEADLFMVFSRLMDLGVKELYNPVVAQRQPPKKADTLFSWSKEEENDLLNKDRSDDHDVSSVLKRCHRIHHRYLQAVDAELYNYLESQKIESQMYLQRWLRCVLSREFTLFDTLILWDAIFACVNPKTSNKNISMTGKIDFNNELTLLDFTCVGMMIFVRSFLLESDSSRILQRLLKFPPVEDITSIINMAINYKDYILGGCTSAKPSILPNGASPPPSLSTPTTNETRSIPAPLSQSIPKKPVNIQEHERSFQRQISMQVSKSPNRNTPGPESVKTLKEEDPLGASIVSKPSRSPATLETAKPILQSGDSRPMVERVTEVIKLLQSQISAHTMDEVRMVRSIDTLKSVKRDLLRQLAKSTSQGI